MPGEVTYERAVPLPLSSRSVALRFDERYFSIAEPTGATDVFACLFCDEPLQGWRVYRGATRLIDLTSELDQVFGELTRNVRYEINRAERTDSVTTALVMSPTIDDVERFTRHYDAFAAGKGLPPANRAQLDALQRAGKLVLSFAERGEADLLATHAYILESDRVRLTHSASLFRREDEPKTRQVIGRANRLLHWKDLAGLHRICSIYDLGGWYEGTTDHVLLQINSFKSGFGGRVVSEWSSFRSESALGRLYLVARDVKLRRKR
jgi:hypothetical protein